MKILAVLAMLILGGLAEPLARGVQLVFDGTNYVALRTVFTNRVETFTNTAGKAFVGVRVESIGTEGLTWWGTNGFSGGRVPLAELSPETRERLAIPAALVNFKATSDAEKREAKLKAYFDLADRRREALSESTNRVIKAQLDSMVEFLEKERVFTGWTSANGVMRLKVGLSFFALDYDTKQAAATAMLARALDTDSSIKILLLLDRYSNKEIGSLDRFGFRLN